MLCWVMLHVYRKKHVFPKYGGWRSKELKAKYDAIPEDQRTNTHNAHLELRSVQ